MAIEFACDVDLIYSTSTQLVCSSGWRLVSVLATEFNPNEIDPVLMAGAIGAGFFMLLPLWFAISGGRKLLSVIR